MTAAFDNAGDLVADAQLLLDNGRAPRAYALGVLAAEEIGKVILLGKLAALLSLGRPVDWDAVSADLADHGHKLFNFASLTSLLDTKLAEWARGDTEAIDADEEGVLSKAQQEALTAGELRRRAMYVDVTDSGIQTPGAAISIEMAAALLKGVEFELERLPAVGIPPSQEKLVQMKRRPEEVQRAHALAKRVNRLRPRDFRRPLAPPDQEGNDG